MFRTRRFPEPPTLQWDVAVPGDPRVRVSVRCRRRACSPRHLVTPLGTVELADHANILVWLLDHLAAERTHFRGA
jgi:hypothetical protein